MPICILFTTMTKSNSKENEGCTRLKRVAVSLIVISVACFVGAALTPPLWYVDGSVLAGMGIIFSYVALLYAWEATDRGIDAKIKIRDAEIELNNPDNKE